MSVRIMGGYLKGYPIKTLPGHQMRPTTGRVREAIFSILQHEITGSEVLDIFAGSGALAIEAISRGAASAVLIEKNQKAAAVIRKNLEKCHLDLRLIATHYRTALEILSTEEKKFDLVFADPPYELIRPNEMFDLLANYPLVKPNGFLIMEHSGSLSPEGGDIIKTRRFGDSAVTIYKYE